MPEPKSDLRLEIAHVLFIDIVGYSKRLIDEQHELLQDLNQIVRNTAAFRSAEASANLIRVPTGDGMALVFSTTPEAPVQCALEISKALRSHSELQVRMGIHSGPVSGIKDVNDRSNIAGAGINVAQRVMDCGDGGHILLSKRVAEDLEQYRQWRPYLHELGECEVKHGARVSLVNLYSDEVGNPAIPEKLKKERETTSAAPSVKPAKVRKPLLLTGAILVTSALVIGFWAFSHRHSQKVANALSSPEKRIAVLPFKPLVPENRDQVLEMGMADSLIAKLSNIREIVVRSLNSVRKYSGLDQDPVAAGRELEVSSVLEGNVQKSSDRIRVSARLINVADGSSLWANTFDEKFTDVFAVQDAISQKVADALALRLSGEENKRLTRRYTENVEAYQLYLTGRYHWNKLTPPEITKSIEFFKKAIELDPTYALAYFGLADAYRSLAPTSEVPSKDTLPQAQAAATKALELDETLAEPHATLAFIHTWYDWDWSAAEREAKRAIELNPNWSFGHIAYAQMLSVTGRSRGSNRRRCPRRRARSALPNHQRTQWLPSSPGKTRRRGYCQVKKDGRTGFEFLDCASIFGNGLYREENVPRSHFRIQSGRKIVRRKFRTASTEWLCLGIVRRHGERTGGTTGIKISRKPTLRSAFQSRAPLLCPGRKG